MIDYTDVIIGYVDFDMDYVDVIIGYIDAIID